MRWLDPWSASQRRGLVIVFGVFILILAVRLSFNRMTVPDPQPWQGAAAGRLADRLDPNVADAAELAAIPTLGEKRAQLIVEYRQRFLARHSGKLAFGRVEDLLNIKGIGSATVETLEPYLIFPASEARPASAPAAPPQL
jgi:hypothetical protein